MKSFINPELGQKQDDYGRRGGGCEGFIAIGSAKVIDGNHHTSLRRLGLTITS